MKSKPAILFFLIGLFVFSGAFCQDQFSKEDTLALLLKNSAVNNNNLFMVFGWQGCGWCRLFDKYHSDSAVHEILGKYFDIAKIDINKSKAGADLFKAYGKNGTPSWTIFDSNGEVLVDSDNGNGNVGYPAEENEIEHYVKALKKTAPALSDSECEILVAKLKDYRNRKKQILL